VSCQEARQKVAWLAALQRAEVEVRLEDDPSRNAMWKETESTLSTTEAVGQRVGQMTKRVSTKRVSTTQYKAGQGRRASTRKNSPGVSPGSQLMKSKRQSVVVLQENSQSAVNLIAVTAADVEATKKRVQAHTKIRERLVATGAGLVAAPLAGAVFGVGGLLAPNYTKQKTMSEGLKTLERSMILSMSRVQLYVTEAQRQRIHRGFKAFFIEGGKFEALAAVLIQIAKEIMANPDNAVKLEAMAAQALGYAASILKSKFGVEIYKEEIDELGAAARNMINGLMDKAMTTWRRLVTVFLQDKERMKAISSMIDVILVKYLGLDPQVCALIHSTKDEIFQSLKEDLTIDVDSLLVVAHKVQHELMDYLEHAVFRPAIIGICGGEDKMPVAVEKRVIRFSNFLWDEVKRDLDRQTRLALDKKLGDKEAAEAREKELLTSPDYAPLDWGKAGCFRRFRAWFLYHGWPYDKNMWTKLYDPWWLFFNAILCQPSTTIRIFYYGTMLVMIDRTDEYQLLHFVRSFKSWHFLSTGVMGMIVGASLYIKCINVPYPLGVPELDLWQEQLIASTAGLDPSNPAYQAIMAAVNAPPPTLSAYVAMPNLQACHEFGPGSFKLYFIEIIFFFCNILIVWWAFFLMKGSSKKGLVDSNLVVDTKHGAANKTSREDDLQATPWHLDGTNVWEAWRSMYWLLLGDLFFFFGLCTIFFLFMLYIVDFNIVDLQLLPQWQYSGLLFWLRTFYGLCAAPFLVFLMPFEGVFFVKVLLLTTLSAGYLYYSRHCLQDNCSTHATAHYTAHYTTHYITHYTMQTLTAH
jgi:hypothetical protein